MTNRNPEDEKQWNVLHEEIKLLMQQELSITRELLANMHQEELSLMLRDPGSLNQVMQQRSSMLERLSGLRVQRQQTTQKIYPLIEVQTARPSLEEILPLNEEISYEIFNLRDQLLALTERMNRQQHRNTHLEEHLDPRGNPVYMQAQPLYPPMPRPKKKQLLRLTT
jgi:hypothetical protein